MIPIAEPVPDEDRFLDLLVAWQEARDSGREPSTDELCPNDPVLREQLRNHIAAARALESGAGGPSAVPALPSAIPGYRIGGELARGGMGVVLSAHDVAFDREVAVKVLRPGYAAEAAAERFVAEARITARLQHPGVPPVHALGTLPDGRPFLAMKLVRGATLAARLADRPDAPRDLPRLVAAFGQICQAVGYAHSQGVVHRDLKPANVMVGAFGEIQVMDWGLARESAAAEAVAESDGRGPAAPPGRTRAGQVLGTPAYMAPEQARGEPADARSDVFALGGILCEILTGKPAWAWAPPGPAVERAASGDVTGALAALRACGADAELVALAGRCLAPSPSDRPADAKAVADAVAAHAAEVEGRLRKAENDRAATEVRVAEQAKRRRTQLRLALAVAALILGGAATAWWARAQAAERGEQERQARAGVGADLGHAAELRRQYRYREAADVVGRAGARLSTGLADDLKPAVARAAADVEFVRDLDAVRMKKTLRTIGEAGRLVPDLAAAPPAYRAAFAARGYDWANGVPDELAARVGGSDVKAELVGALDDWALDEPDPGVAARLLAAARAADPGGWRDGLRDPAVRDDASRLQVLLEAAAADPAGAEAASVFALAQLAGRRGLDPCPLLLAAYRDHRPDFLFALGLGIAYHERDPQAAMGYYRVAAALRPDDAAPLYNQGILLGNAGEHAAALAAFDDALRLDPGAPVHSNRGVVLRLLGRLDEAEAAYREAIRRDPGRSGVALTNLGNILGTRGDAEGALSAHREAVKVDPAYAVAHNNLAHALCERGQQAEGIAAYREAVRLAPALALARGGLGIQLHLAGRSAEAVPHLRKAMELEPKNPAFALNLSAALAAAGDRAGALKVCRDAFPISPTDRLLRGNLVTLLKQAGDDAGVIEVHRAWVKAAPLDPSAHEDLGTALFYRGDTPGAVAAYREAARLAPGKPGSHARLGAVLHQSGDFAAAADCFREAVRLDPNSAGLHCALGQVLEDGGRFAEALGHLRKGHELGSARPGWDMRSADHVTQCEGFIRLEKQLPEAISGAKGPGSAAEALAYADVCRRLARHGDAVRFYRQGLGDPKRELDPQDGVRFRAAREALLATSGPGDAPPAGRAELRGAALGWLAAEVAAWEREAAKGRPQAAEARKAMRAWLADPAFAPVRDRPHLSKLPGAEAKEWAGLWASVGALEDRLAPAK